MFYEKIKKQEFDDARTNAVILANAVAYASPPSFGQSRSDGKRKQRGWNKFLDSLDWNKLTKKEKDTTDYKKAKHFFGSIGIPVNTGKKKKDVK